ncbi:putative Sulfur acceptor protein SufE for iron-sulfur cluster assembly [Vibrio nigripulchritudo MADA3029]|uniref:cysteine desulfurase sulfur acceptor subunit CsdE n=1 Tax=Vibrio nigripulchritudo TaxID=28173 RepID=UPI0003B1BFE5|nr:cysteine desulfurase sulfur acceptor subunit CsdE [Vibrio nigripulchritudo]CCN47101.1 putative Sulfur acceptor protein SufE for iron-sulfur cluster assembly [Vibrio nigripulchritudo MADA3020]CCN51044.1 putative Sulfur acceptor protein SufE for iron-sulfur cluster assembly [Vibrio nigripulchritudo MADA3021]CCN60563.1 putative Sulfur acceptor protein SufE for iron-sulfur cluster assembly [Vibrio nigripulchritudo MADA3029]
MSNFPSSPFGTDISSEQIAETMQGFKSWEDRYRQVIQWGKKLPDIPEDLKADTVTISGCESQVWFVVEKVGEQWHFCADSDARIVRGLIAIVLAAYEGKTSEQIQSFDIDAYFEVTGLFTHLSPSRGNGLKAIVKHIQTITR